MAEKAAGSAIPVLIEGESGVGKELIARAIHGSSERATKPFVAVNCGAIPDNLVESILFGHEKGAFTGATERHAGKFVEASGGTLFLDEVSELPQAAQVKLLRALQEGEVEAVGGRKPIKVDVRIISATNRNLLERAKAGHFREDLFYRLHVLPLTVPPLRDAPRGRPAPAAAFSRALPRRGKSRHRERRCRGAGGAREPLPGPATSASSRTRFIAPSSSASAANSGCRISRCSRATMRPHGGRIAEARPRRSGRHRAVACGYRHTHRAHGRSGRSLRC